MGEGLGLVKEHLRSLSDRDIGYLASRCSHNWAGDRHEVLNVVCRNRDIDRMFFLTDDANECYDLMDDVRDLIFAESKRREDETRGGRS